MQYFITEAERTLRKSTLYFEFQRGKHRNRFWKEDSLCLHADTFDRLFPSELVLKVLPHFSYYGVTEVTEVQYAALKASAMEWGGETAAAVMELEAWAVDCFRKERIFTILGV